jgi:hypothetical protein
MGAIPELYVGCGRFRLKAEKLTVATGRLWADL